MSLFKARHKGEWNWCMRTVNEGHLQKTSEAFRQHSLHGEDGDHFEWNWLLLPDIPEEKLLLTFQEMLAMGITDKAKPWNPALNMCILCCHGEKGNVCKSLFLFFNQGRWTSAYSARSRLISERQTCPQQCTFICPFQQHGTPTLCYKMVGTQYVPKGIQKSRQHKTAQ